MDAAEILENIKASLRNTIAVEIPSHCGCCPNRYEEGLETERDYAEQLLSDIAGWEAMDEQQEA